MPFLTQAAGQLMFRSGEEFTYMSAHNNSTQYAPSGPDAQTPRAAGAPRYMS